MAFESVKSASKLKAEPENSSLISCATFPAESALRSTRITFDP